MDGDEKVCIRCNETSKEDEDPLNHVGSKFIEGKNRKHPIDTLIEQASNVGLSELVECLEDYKHQKKAVYIHLSCRTALKNNARKKKNETSEEQTTEIEAKRSRRSDTSETFDFKKNCFYCENICEYDKKHPDRDNFSLVSTKDTKIHQQTLTICRSREDTYSKSLERRLMSVIDLVSAEARYHRNCRSSFENTKPKYVSRGRPTCEKKVLAFNEMCAVIEDSMELYTIKQFHDGMSEKYDNIYSLKMTRTQLLEKYGANIEFVSRGKNTSDVILLSHTSHILTETWYNEKKSDINAEAQRVIKTAARLIRNDIKNHSFITDSYPGPQEILDTQNAYVPSLLRDFIEEIVKNPLKQCSLSQAICSAAKPRLVLPIQFGLAVATDNQLASKWLTQILSRLGFSVSYDELTRYKQNVVKSDPIDEILCPYETSFLQFVGDNTGHDLATVDGKNTHHGLGSIAIANGKFSDIKIARKVIPRNKKVNWAEVTSNKGITIKQYHMQGKIALKGFIMKPIAQTHFKRHFLNTLWECMHLFNEKCPNWSGYMSSISSDKSPKSVVTMLPIINLHATDMSALYSLLLFVIGQSEKINVPMPAITFDQPLYVKAQEIVLSKNMNIFVRLGGFHQLMSFLGSIGNLMEESGISAALETVYAPVTVGHMLSGKAYARAIRGHFLCATAIMSLVLAEFWKTLDLDEQCKLKEMSTSDDPSLYENHDVALKLAKWLEYKEKELSASSRTSALWINYCKYIEIVQQYIQAERSNNWDLHIYATKQMLNLFAATGHNNYAKSCRMYLQAAANMEMEHPDLFEQFLIGNHTVRQTDKSWTGNLHRISIEKFPILLSLHLVRYLDRNLGPLFRYNLGIRKLGRAGAKMFT